MAYVKLSDAFCNDNEACTSVRCIHVDLVETCTVNPLYNGIRYNSNIRYNVNPICTKIKSLDRVLLFDRPMFFCLFFF